MKPRPDKPDMKERLYDDRSNKEAEREARVPSGGRGPTEGDPSLGMNHLEEDQPPSERATNRKPRK